MYFFVKIKKYILPSLVGIEPTTFGLEVQRAILCATGTVHKLLQLLFHIKHKNGISIAVMIYLTLLALFTLKMLI